MKKSENPRLEAFFKSIGAVFCFFLRGRCRCFLPACSPQAVLAALASFVDSVRFQERIEAGLLRAKHVHALLSSKIGRREEVQYVQSPQDVQEPADVFLFGQDLLVAAPTVNAEDASASVAGDRRGGRGRGRGYARGRGRKGRGTEMWRRG